MESGTDLARHFYNLPTGNLSDALGKKGAMHSGIKPVYPKARVAGPALTLTCHPADNLTIHKAMEMAAPGTVLVVQAGGYAEAGLFGAMMALACQVKGIAGLVLDGGCRDVDELEEMDFPVFARGVNPNGTVKETLGAIGAPIQCGGQVVHTDDIIVGDRDGVIVVPLAQAADALEKARAIFEKEIKVRELLRQGKSTMEVYGFDDLLRKKGLA